MVPVEEDSIQDVRKVKDLHLMTHHADTHVRIHDQLRSIPNGSKCGNLEKMHTVARDQDLIRTPGSLRAYILITTVMIVMQLRQLSMFCTAADSALVKRKGQDEHQVMIRDRDRDGITASHIGDKMTKPAQIKWMLTGHYWEINHFAGSSQEIKVLIEQRSLEERMTQTVFRLPCVIHVEIIIDIHRKRPCTSRNMKFSWMRRLLCKDVQGCDCDMRLGVA